MCSPRWAFASVSPPTHGQLLHRFWQVNNELQLCRREEMRVWRSCSSVFLGSIGSTLAIFLILNSRVWGRLLKCWLKLRYWSKTASKFQAGCVVLVVSGPRLWVTLLEIRSGANATVLSVFSCRKLETIQSLMPARQRCKESRLLQFSGINETYNGESLA